VRRLAQLLPTDAIGGPLRIAVIDAAAPTGSDVPGQLGVIRRAKQSLTNSSAS